METTLPCSATNSSNCSRSVGVIQALTPAVRFSRFIKKGPGASHNPGGRSPQTGGGSVGACSSGHPCCQPAASPLDALVNVWMDAAKFVLPALGDGLPPLANSRAGDVELPTNRLHCSEHRY